MLAAVAISESVGSWRGSASVSRSLVSAARSADIARPFIEPAASGTENQNARVPSGICSSASSVSSTSRAQSGHSSMRTPSSMRSPTETGRSEEHTSELQSLMRISYDVLFLKKKKEKPHKKNETAHNKKKVKCKSNNNM